MKTLLVALPRPDAAYGALPAHYAIVNGREVVQHGQGVADELRDLKARSLRLSVDSAANVTERLRLRALSRRFVPVLVQRHLADGGYFTERFRVRAQVKSLRQGEAEVDVMAMLEDDAELAQELLPSRERPLTHLVTAEASVAALVGAVTAEPVLVHWWHAGGLRTLGVRRGRVVWQWLQPLSPRHGQGEDEAWKPLLESAASSAPAEFSGPHSNVIRLGPGPWMATGEWASNGSRERVQQIGSLFRGVPADEVLQHPELYGLAFAQRQQSLIVNGYRQRVQAWQWGGAVAATTAVAGALLLGLGAWWHNEASLQMARHQLESSRLAALAKTVNEQRPSAAALAALRSASWREKALGVNLRADRFLSELFAKVPHGAQVLMVKVQRDDAASERVRLKDGQPERVARAGRARQSAPQDEPVLAQADTLQRVSVPLNFTPAVPTRRMPVPGEPSYQIELKIALAGGYSGAKLKAEQLAEDLSRLGRLSDTRMTFEDQGPLAPGAQLQTRLTIAAGAF